MTTQQPQTQGGATGYETRMESGQQGIGGQQMGTTGQQMGGKQPTMGQQGQQMGPQSEQTFESSLDNSMRLALHDFVQAGNVCEWCADQCIGHGPEMAECIRLCRDVADFASLNVKLMARDSIFGPETAQLFVEAAQECAMECAQHPNPHCQECASVLQQAVESTKSMLASFQQGGTIQGQTGTSGMQAGQIGGATQGGMGQSTQQGTISQPGQQF